MKTRRNTRCRSAAIADPDLTVRSPSSSASTASSSVSWLTGSSVGAADMPGQDAIRVLEPASPYRDPPMAVEFEELELPFDDPAYRRRAS